MKNDTPVVRSCRYHYAILTVSAVFSLGWALTTQAQVAHFAPKAAGPAATVSVRELSIPQKAREEFERGVRLLAKQDTAQSKRHFDAAIQKYPDYYEAYYHHGIVALRRGDNREAAQNFQKAIDLSRGTYTPAEFGVALVLLREGRLAEAERVARHGLEADPDNVDGHVVLGFVMLKLNRTEEAERHGRQALASGDPNAAKGLLVLSDVHAATKNYDKQVSVLDAYLKLRPDDPNKKTLLIVRDVAKRLAAKPRPNANK
jgi:Tfp pilus assembly protein PilF